MRKRGPIARVQQAYFLPPDCTVYVGKPTIGEGWIHDLMGER